MYAVRGIYDGSCFRLSQPIPVKESYEVVITFTEPAKSKTSKDILSYFGTWDAEDVAVIGKIFEERTQFSIGRDEL
jgi:hypothetical protein